MRTSTRLCFGLLLSIPLAGGLASGCGSDGQTGTAAGSAGTTSGAGGNSAGSSVGGAGETGGASGGVGGASGGVGGASGGVGGASGTATGTGTASTGSGGHPVTACQGHVYACGDGLDNDGDGLIDSDDPDCLGPCDNTESSYHGGIPGQNNAPCKQDCYFDQDTGPGNDDCYWDHKCDPHEVAPAYTPESGAGSQCAYDAKANVPGTSKTCDQLYNAQSQACTDYCGPLTPNGCDCFGCCELPAGSQLFVWLGSTDASKQGSCDLATVGDPTKCQPCEPVKACLNTCGHCELCIGKTTLPADCNQGSGAGGGSAATGSGATSGSGAGGGNGGGQCAPGVQACGLPGQAACPGNYYCITGCCQQIPG